VSAAARPWAADILHHWFHELDAGQWFGRNEAVDAQLRRRYGRLHRALCRQPASRFLTDPLTARGAILLFDQVPRNIHRESALAFATDRLARQITRGAIARGWHRPLGRSGRQFLYMPLMHSEAITDQRRSLRLFTALDSAFITRFARAHYRMIARFGRFPHRNDVIGRKSSAAERRAVASGMAW
jgi:uncharacterized protein (DUF924 family)